MKYRIFFLAITLLFLSFTEVQGNKKKALLEKAKTHITQLKSGVLLVRLYDKHKVIKILKEKGMVMRAKAIKEKQNKLNKEIIESFAKFNFSQVYFFYGKNSKLILEKKYSKIELMVTQDSIAKNVTLDSNFLVADFGFLEKEMHLDDDTSNTDKKKGITKVKRYKGSNINTRIRCMYLRDSHLNQLQKPFPFYVRFHPSPLHQLTYEEVVEKMNMQLLDFYSKTQ